MEPNPAMSIQTQRDDASRAASSFLYGERQRPIDTDTIAALLDSERILYKNLMRFFYSAEEVMEDQTETITIGGEAKTFSKQIKKLKLLPDESMQCPICYKVYDAADPNRYTCKEHKDDSNNIVPVKTRYYRWRPILNSAGFNAVINSVIANTNTLISTGNYPSYFNIEEAAKNIGKSIGQMILENQFEWINQDTLISRGMRINIVLTVSFNVYAAFSRGVDGKMLEKILADIRKLEHEIHSNQNQQPQQKKAGGIANPLNWF